MSAPVVGFDLDLTLIDTRAGIAATYRALAERSGVAVDTDAVVSRIGIPLAEEVAHWFPADQVDTAVQTFRELYPAHAIEVSRALPGAAAAIAAVRDQGGRVVVITSKLDRLATAHLTHLGIEVDAVCGNRFGDGKVAALREYGAHSYVGDHLADVRSARAAQVTAVAVATGPYDATALAAAGADVVLPDLRGFPEWLARAPIAQDSPNATR
ncbi:HAD hydrolase-like protein [Natronosporangium hydrolyticum]|uniref:HAD hydrolase-like protein n=1 Tax=Natronosporangium hydrolyticum TaxID=2811111 RepID=A0A895Y9N7_9ACTN|nr:HAD hydrolase-like protein [Natronosporangium hydrolyticum]QSB14457.1 HAD hydrolase-like protein [Natronosporangium hydrolyticum]